MTTVIRQNGDWLKEQISEAVDYMLDNDRGRIKELIIRNLMEQLYFTGCLMHSDNDTEQCGKLVIEIDLPNPEKCDEALEKMDFSIAMMI